MGWFNFFFIKKRKKVSTIFYSPTDEARRWRFVREVPQNKGLMVEAIQHWSGGQPGDSWCAYFVLVILDICFQGKDLNPIKRSGAVQDIYEQAKANGWMTDHPMKDDLFIYVDDNNHAHHIGIFTEGGNGIAGNTSPDGLSSNGAGVFEHQLISNPAHIKFIHYPR